MSKMSGLKAVVGLSFASVIGLTLLVLGCALPAFGSWWPLFVLAFYILAPFPLFFARNCYGVDPHTPSPCTEFAYFITTAIVLSAFAFPFVLAHAGAIKWGAFALTSLASSCMLSTIFFGMLTNFSHDDGYGQALF